MPVANPTAMSYTGNGTGYAVQVNGRSTFTLGNGGTLNGVNDDALDAHTAATIRITGGTLAGTGLIGEALYADGSGPITISGGTFTSGTNGNGIDIVGSSVVTITGGTFTGQNIDAGISFGGSGPVTISGGAFTAPFAGLYTNGSGTVTISGGTFTATGMSGYGLYAAGGGIIDLFGTFDGYKAGDKITSGSGTITGRLLNGQTFSTTYFAGIAGRGTGTIEFNVVPAPEPSQFAVLGSGVLGLGALALRVRRRARAA